MGVSGTIIRWPRPVRPGVGEAVGSKMVLVGRFVALRAESYALVPDLAMPLRGTRSGMTVVGEAGWGGAKPPHPSDLVRFALKVRSPLPQGERGNARGWWAAFGGAPLPKRPSAV
jgi:hypothetical protein